jgi:signal transduction histidine kinase
MSKEDKDYQSILRDKIKALLDQKTPDYGEILELSSKYAACDPDNIRFTADAALIDRLGLQLVARQETAVSELVKNAYDADATHVKLVFSSRTTAGGRLIISDNGSGMTRQQLADGFMRLAAGGKSRSPVSPIYNRQRAGRKGIGRFAVQRLGKRLTLITQTEDADTAYKIEIDWSLFERDLDLLTIANKIEKIEKQQSQGTLLIIDDLREGWSDNQISRVYRYVEDLIQPLEIVGDNLVAESENGFSVAFFRMVGPRESPIASEQTMVTEHALAKVTASVDSNGIGSWTIQSKRLSVNESNSISPSPDKPDAPYEFLKNIKFSAHYFIILPEYVPSLEMPRLRKLAERCAGIRLYRNGFRVLPYGETRNDWLGLDEINRRRKILAPVHNLNWFGYVEVRDIDGELFEETSSREGLKNNPAFEELTTFIAGVAMLAASRIQEKRGKKVKASQKDYKKSETNLTADLTKAASDLEKEAEQMEKSNSLLEPKDSSIKRTRQLASLLRNTAEQSHELFEENGMLRVLASLGLTIGTFTHEVSLGFVALESEMKSLLGSSGLDEEAKKAVHDLKDHFKILQSYTAYFDRAISENVNRERRSIEINWAIHDFIREFALVASQDNIIFRDIEIDPDGLSSPPMHPSEWASILTNLFTNSRKAIRRCNNLTQGLISISARRENHLVIIDFSDNGDGIPEINKERVFNAFFTTTHLAPNSSDRDLAGTGLGLKIVKDIVESAGGEIYVSSPQEGYSTSIRIELPVVENAEDL